MEYRIVKEKKKRFRIDRRKKILGINLKWKELYGWQTFANDDGGWPISLRFESKKDAKKYLKSGGIKEVAPGLGLYTTKLPKGTYQI